MDNDEEMIHEIMEDEAQDDVREHLVIIACLQKLFANF
jgi:hypothetical protein